MKSRIPILFCLLALSRVFAGSVFAAPVPAPGELRCEYLVNPEGIDVVQPRLSWKIQAQGHAGIKQSAYQILVASSRDLLDKGTADLWDSGKVAGDRSIQIPYAGKPLQSRQQCFWRVRIWTGADTAQSPAAFWSMGLLNPEDWHAQWISCPENPETKDAASIPAIYLRKEAAISKAIRRATAYVQTSVKTAI